MIKNITAVQRAQLPRKKEKKVISEAGISVWRESQDGELIEAGNILSFSGPKKMESSFAGSVLRGAWSGSLPTMVKGAAGITFLAGGIMDKLDGEKETVFKDKTYYKKYVEMMNWANYNSHTNEDEDLGFLVDFNSAVNQVSNGVTQMTGIFMTSGGAALGLKFVGKLGVKLADDVIMKIATEAAMFVGAAEAVGPISQEMLAVGYTPEEAALPLFIAGGITYASERVLGMNIAQKFGASMVLNRTMGEVGRKDVSKAISKVIGRELGAVGAKSVGELDELAKKTEGNVDMKKTAPIKVK